MGGRAIQVFVVDDHAMVRSGITAMFERLYDITVVGVASSGQAAIARLAALDGAGTLPDVVLMDLMMPGMNGIEATAIITRRHPGLRVVAVSSYAEQDTVHAAVEAGATGYLLKHADVDELAAAVRAAHRGQAYLDPQVAMHLAHIVREPAAPSGRLTGREREILGHIAAGEPNMRIASRLTISERTVRTHVSNILAKLGLESRTQAALWAVREGIAKPGGQ